MRSRKVILNEDEPLTPEELKVLGKVFTSRIGARIREIRHMQGLTLPEINERFGIGLSQLSRVEQGKVDTTTATVVKIALALNARPSDIYVPRDLNPELRPKRREAPLLDSAVEEAVTRFLKQIGARVRELRQIQGFSLERLKSFAGMTVSDITIIERGQRNLRASTIMRITDGLGVLPHEVCIPSEQSGFRLKIKARKPRQKS